jgi:hypothetical protein
MNRKGLSFKFILPVTLALAGLLGAVIWGVSAYQTAQSEQAFEDLLSSLAVASRVMIHSEAEAYCKRRGMTFHRVLEGSLSKDPAAEPFERASLRHFAEHPEAEARTGRFEDAKGDSRVYVLSPGRQLDANIESTTGHGRETGLCTQEACWTRTAALRRVGPPPAAWRPSRRPPPASWRSSR